MSVIHMYVKKVHLGPFREMSESSGVTGRVLPFPVLKHSVSTSQTDSAELYETNSPATRIYAKFV